MVDQNVNIPRGFHHDGWWMSPDVEVDLPSGAQRDASVNSRPLRVFLLMALLLTAAADWLFWGYETGLSLAIFALLVGAGTLAVFYEEVDFSRKGIAMGILTISVLPVIEMVQALSVLFLLVGMVSFALIIGEKFTKRLFNDVSAYLLFPLSGPVWLWCDGRAKLQGVKGELPAVDLRNLAINWVMPVGMGLVFLGLFTQANPLIDRWLIDAFDFDAPDLASLRRLLFWGGMFCLIWPFLRIRYGRWPQMAVDKMTLRITLPAILNPTAIRNALVLFNLMFALQTVLDLAILWGGANLPDGMTYAAYAHRGAYPLIATALLAGGFVIVATSFGAVSRLVRGLIYLWIAQNVVLVVSSILRLDLYVEIYSLTRLRMAAFIWMGLVVVGLVLIVVRVMRDKDNHWLLRMNAVAASLVLYACCFVNFAGVIADYNIARQGGVGAVHQPWDVSYFCELGHGAAPAKARQAIVSEHPVRCAWSAAINYPPETANWRDWGFRDWRLRRELANLRAPATEADVDEPYDTYRR